MRRHGCRTSLLSSAMRRTWVDHPLPWRIVEDVSRYSLVIDRIVECQGFVVADHTAQHGGCSKHKRRETKVGAALASRESRVPAECGDSGHHGGPVRGVA